MYENENNFSIRLAQLRNIKGVSARDMSLSLGQNPGYINNIESGKSLPSMAAFFYICKYRQIRAHCTVVECMLSGVSVHAFRYIVHVHKLAL